MAVFRCPGVELLAAVIVCAGVVCVVSDRALARAGGGGGYSGSSSGSSGSGGSGYSGGSYGDDDSSSWGSGDDDGGGSGVSGGDLAQGILGLIVIVIGAIVWGCRKLYLAIRQRILRLGQEMRERRLRRQRLSAISRFDAEFNADTFDDRVRDAFVKIQRAWSDQRIDKVRAFVSDGVFERFSLQIEEQRDLGYRNVMDLVLVRGLCVARLDRDKWFETVEMKITASANDYRARLDDNRRIPGTSRPASFTEYWTFIRRRGVKTLPGKPGLIEGFCPNCGADIRLNRSARCKSCDSLIRNGEYDWVLAEITQACEWKSSESLEPGWMIAYRQCRDEAFNVHCLEDRASVIFWRKVMADRIGEVGPIKKMAAADFCDQYAETLRSSTYRGRREYFGDCAVGCVDVLGVLPGEDMDRALVQIRWSGSSFTQHEGGRVTSSSFDRLHDSLFVLGRRSGVKTRPEQGLISAHCPRCGAPEEKLTSQQCDSCGEVVNDGSHDWVLLDILRTGDRETRELIHCAKNVTHVDYQAATAVGTPGEEGVAAGNGDADGIPGCVALLGWAINTAMANGRIEDSERKMLMDLALRRGVTEKQLDSLIDATLRDELYLLQPEDRQQAERWLTAMADISLSDGTMGPSEHVLLRRVGAGFKMEEGDVKKLVRERQRELYRAARDELREAKFYNAP